MNASLEARRRIDVGAPALVPDQRFEMYIVISKPKRKSSNAGCDHCMRVSLGLRRKPWHGVPWTGAVPQDACRLWACGKEVFSRRFAQGMHGGNRAVSLKCRADCSIA